MAHPNCVKRIQKIHLPGQLKCIVSAGTVVTTEGIDLIGKCFGIMCLVPFFSHATSTTATENKMVSKILSFNIETEFWNWWIELSCNVSLIFGSLDQDLTLSNYKWLQSVLVWFCCVVAIVEGFYPFPQPRLPDSRVVFSPVWPNCVLHERQVELLENPWKSRDSTRISKAFKSKDVTWQPFFFKERNFRADAQSHERQCEVSGTSVVEASSVCNRLSADSPKPILSDVSQHHRSMVHLSCVVWSWITIFSLHSFSHHGNSQHKNWQNNASRGFTRLETLPLICGTGCNGRAFAAHGRSWNDQREIGEVRQDRRRFQGDERS